jgi:hypothetical protein
VINIYAVKRIFIWQIIRFCALRDASDLHAWWRVLIKHSS